MVAFLLVLTFATAVHAGWGNWLTSFVDAPTSEPTFTSAETSCLDTIEWCRDPHHFMYPNCGSWVEGETPAPTTSDFDPATCQVLYNMIDQNNCIVQAFRSTDAPCAGVPVPEYNNHALNLLEASVACKRFSIRQMECVSLFSIHDPTLDEVNEAVDCILKKAGRHEYKHNKDAQLCLKTPKPSTVANTNAETNDEPTARPTLSGMVHERTARPTLSGMVHERTARPTLSGMVHERTARPTLSGMVHERTARPTLSGMVHTPTARPTLSGMVLKPKFGSTTHGTNNLDAGNDPLDCPCPPFCHCPLATPVAAPKIGEEHETNDEPTARPTLSGMVHTPTARPTLSGMVHTPTARPTLSGMVLKQNTAKCGCICPGASQCHTVYACTPAERQAQLARCPNKLEGVSAAVMGSSVLGTNPTPAPTISFADLVKILDHLPKACGEALTKALSETTSCWTDPKTYPACLFEGDAKRDAEIASFRIDVQGVCSLVGKKFFKELMANWFKSSKDVEGQRMVGQSHGSTAGNAEDKIPFIPMMATGADNGAGNNLDCTSWFCPCQPPRCYGRRLLTGATPLGTIEKQTDQIPFIPMMAAATIPSDPTCNDVLDWCLDPYNFMVKDCPNFSTAKDFDPRTCQNLYTILGQSDCIVRAFDGLLDEDPCAHVQLPYGDFNEEALEMDAASVACENFSFANGLCVDKFSKLNPTDEDNIRAFKCIFDAAKQPKFAEDDDAKACLKFKKGALGTIEKQTDKIPFIPMMAASTIPSDPTCADVLDWCNDPHNFMVKDCPNFSTSKDFDPATCQNLYTMMGQNDCILRAFDGLVDADPCANVQLPYGDYDEKALAMDGAIVSCENYSFANGLCVKEFSKLNPTHEDIIRAFKCIFDAAKQPKFAEDENAKLCLKFKDMLP